MNRNDIVVVVVDDVGVECRCLAWNIEVLYYTGIRMYILTIHWTLVFRESGVITCLLIRRRARVQL